VPDAHCCGLAGDGPERGALEAQAARLGVDDRVRFLGGATTCRRARRLRPCSYARRARSTLGNVVIEAWRHGRPVVASEAAGPGALIRDGVDGLLVPVEDAAALAAAVGRLLADPGLGRGPGRGRDGVRFETCFTEDAVVRRYLDFFDRVAADGAASPA